MMFLPGALVLVISVCALFVFFVLASISLKSYKNKNEELRRSLEAENERVNRLTKMLREDHLTKDKQTSGLNDLLDSTREQLKASNACAFSMYAHLKEVRGLLEKTIEDINEILQDFKAFEEYGQDKEEVPEDIPF